jgi:hypothetical protein
MATEKKTAKRLYTLAAAIGLALGTMGIAAAASPPPSSPAPTHRSLHDLIAGTRVIADETGSPNRV